MRASFLLLASACGSAPPATMVMMMMKMMDDRTDANRHVTITGEVGGAVGG